MSIRLGRRFGLSRTGLTYLQPAREACPGAAPPPVRTQTAAAPAANQAALGRNRDMVIVSSQAPFYAPLVGLVVEEFAPAPALRGVVHRVADFHERAEPLQRLESPLAGIVLIVSLGPDMEIDGRMTGSFVAGVWDRPTITAHHGEQAGYQLYLDLLGARRVLGIPGGELGNQLVELDAVLGEFATELTERLGEAADASERHAIAQRLLADRVSENGEPAPEVAHALARLRATRGAARVESLAGEVGWGRRDL